MFGTPLRYEGEAVGVITVGSTSSSTINAADRLLIEYMANQITTAIIKARLYENERDARMRLSALEDISEAGLTTLGIDELLNEISDRMESSLGVCWSAIVLFENRGGELVVERASRGCRSIKGKTVSESCKILEDVIKSGKVRLLKKTELSKARANFNGKGIKSVIMLTVALRQDRGCVIALGKKKERSFSKKEIELIETLGSRAALAIENALLFNKLEQAYLETIESLVKAVEAKDKYTCGHSEEVAALAESIAIAMGMSEEKAERIYTAGLLHDVGKIGIPSAILSKPSCLSCEEYDAIKLHSVKGYQILKPVGYLQDLAMAVLQHHERYDGTGYPNGLSGEGILIEARILAVADAFQAMISDRPYRKGLSIDRAIIEIKKGSGSQFDPRVAEVLLSVLESKEPDKVEYKGIEVA